MAVEVFRKELTKTDINRRLAVPTQSLGDLPALNGCSYRYFKVNDKSSKKPWKFRLSRRKADKHPKPVWTGDWIEFVKRKQLKKGDKITLIREDGQGPDTRYTIQAMKKKFRLLGQDIWATV